MVNTIDYRDSHTHKNMTDFTPEERELAQWLEMTNWSFSYLDDEKEKWLLTARALREKILDDEQEKTGEIYMVYKLKYLAGETMEPEELKKLLKSHFFK